MGDEIVGMILGILFIMFMLSTDPITLSNAHYKYAVEVCEPNGGIESMRIGMDKIAVCANAVEVNMEMATK